MPGRPAPAEIQGHKEGKESVRTFLNLELREPGDDSEANTTHSYQIIIAIVQFINR